MNSVIQKVREKYPQYSKIGDDELIARIGEKYPQYLQVEDFKADFDRVTRINSEQTALKAEMTQAQQEGEANERKANLLGLSESLVKGVLAGTSMSPKQVMETVEGGIEGAAKLTGLAGPTDELVVKPSRAMTWEPGTFGRAGEAETVPGKIAAGALNAALEFSEVMLSPEGVALLGIGGLPAAARKAVVTGLSANMAAHAPEQFNAAVEAARQGDIQEAAKQATSFLGATAMSAAAGKHATATSGIREATSAEAMEFRASPDQIARNISSPGTLRPQEIRTISGPVMAKPSEMVEFPKEVVDALMATRDQIRTSPELQVLAQRVMLARQRASELEASKLPAGDPALSASEIPGFLKTAEQKIAQRVERVFDDKTTVDELISEPSLQNAVQVKVYKLNGKITIDPPQSLIDSARKVAMGIQRRAELESGNRLNRGEQKPAVEELPDAIQTPDGIIMDPSPNLLLAVQKIKATKDRAAELSQGGKLPTSGREFVSVADIPGAMRTAEQRLAMRRDPVRGTEAEPYSATSTPLRTVEAIVRSKLEQRDWLGAVDELSRMPADASKKTVEKLLGVGKESVPLGAAERTIFNEIWDATVERMSGLRSNPNRAAAQRLAEAEATTRETAVQQAVEQLEASNAPITAEAVKQAAGEPAAPKPAPEIVEPTKPAEPAPQPTRGPQSLGITPEGTEYLQKVIDYFYPADRTAPQEVVVDRANVLPRLQPYEQEINLASRRQGIARLPVIGRLADPRYSAKAPVDRAIITRAHSVNKGQTFGAIWAQVHQPTKSAWDMKSLDESGSMPLTNGQRGYLSDVIEAEIRNPGSQPITPAQRDWINQVWLPVLRDANAMLKAEGVKRVIMEDGAEYAVGEDYFPRPAVGRRNADTSATGSGGGGRNIPGSKQFFQKSRRYETEQEGATGNQQIIYDPDPVSRVSKFISGVYRTIADHRLANDPGLGGTNVKLRLAALKKQYKDVLDVLDKEARQEVEAELAERAGGTSWGETTKLNIAPAFSGKVYPVDVAKKLTRAYGENFPHIIRVGATVSSVAKAFKLTLDVSAPFTQGIGMFFRHPGLWAKATAQHYRALLNREVMSEYMQKPENQQAAQEFAQAGGTVMRLQDFLAGMEKGEPGVRGFKTLGRAIEATGVPGVSKAAGKAVSSVGTAIEATGRAYGVFLDMAKLEMWKAHTKAKAGERLTTKQWAEIAETIENSLFIGRMEQIGLNPGRALVERILALAPSYYRGSVGLITTAFLTGPAGNLARQILASYAAGIALTTVGTYIAMGLSWDEIERRLNPRNGKFMKIPVPAGDGHNVEVGFGNILSSYVRMMGKGYSYFTSDNPIKTGANNNPFLGYLRGKMALLPSVVLDVFIGRDYSGEQQGVFETLVKQFEPLVISQLTEDGPATPGQRIEDAMFSFLGLQSYPENKRGAFLRTREELARKNYQRDYSALTFSEKATLTKSMLNDDRFKREIPNQNQIEQAFAKKLERQNRLQKMVSPENRKKVEELGLNLPGYDPYLSIDGTKVPLTEKEVEAYEKFIVEEYNRSLKLLSAEAVMRQPYGERQEYLNNKLSKAKKIAQGRLKNMKPNQ